MSTPLQRAEAIIDDPDHPAWDEITECVAREVIRSLWGDGVKIFRSYRASSKPWSAWDDANKRGEIAADLTDLCWRVWRRARPEAYARWSEIND